MKKIFLLFSILLTFVLVGCGQSTPDEESMESPIETVVDIVDPTPEPVIDIVDPTPEPVIDVPSSQPDEIPVEESTEEFVETPTEETSEEDMTPAYVQHEFRNVREKDFEQIEYDPEHVTDEWVRMGLYYNKYAQPDEITRYEFIYSADFDMPVDLKKELRHYAYHNEEANYQPLDRSVVQAFYACWDELDVRSDIYIIGYGAPRDMNARSYSWYNEKGWVYAIALQTEEDLAEGENVWSFYVGQDYVYPNWSE